MNRYRIMHQGVEIADLDERDPVRIGDFSAPYGWLLTGGALPDGYVAEPYQPAPVELPPIKQPLVLDRADFFRAVDALAGLTAADPMPNDWLVEQIGTSNVLPEQQRRQALILVRNATQFHRDHPFMDVLAQAILGVTPEQLTQAFSDAAEGLLGAG